MRKLTIPIAVDQVVLRLTEELSAAGLEVARSFDLQSARKMLGTPHECPCPYHGTESCTCQYLVLLVNQPGAPPVTLVAHGHDDHTTLSLEPNATPAIVEAVENAFSRLVEAAVDQG